MSGKFFRIGEGGLHVNDDLVIIADRRSILDREIPGERLESSGVAASDFRAYEIYLRCWGEDVFGSGFGGGC